MEKSRHTQDTLGEDHTPTAHPGSPTGVGSWRFRALTPYLYPSLTHTHTHPPTPPCLAVFLRPTTACAGCHRIDDTRGTNKLVKQLLKLFICVTLAKSSRSCLTTAFDGPSFALLPADLAGLAWQRPATLDLEAALLRREANESADLTVAPDDTPTYLQPFKPHQWEDRCDAQAAKSQT